MIESLAATEHLLELRDRHRVPLADYVHVPEHDLLYVCWRGHLTAPVIVQGAQAGLDLFRGRPGPRRILSDHSHITGDWTEAVPWLHYDWLPQAQRQGLTQMAHVMAAGVTDPLASTPGGAEFTEELTNSLLVRSFRALPAAWHWITTRPPGGSPVPVAAATVRL